MACFTGRILRRLGALEKGDDASVCAGCTAVNQWWEQEGRYLIHFRLRTADQSFVVGKKNREGLQTTDLPHT